MAIKAGVELELHLIDEDGKLAPAADALLARGEPDSQWTHECSLSMIEVHSTPESTMSSLETSLVGELKHAHETAESLGLKLMPSTTLGADTPLPRPGARYHAKEAMLESTRPLEYQIAGTHVHIDQGSSIHEQYNLMTSLDPLFAVLSSTPFLNGSNGVNCHRVETYRKDVFASFPEYGSLLGYFSSDESLRSRFLDLHRSWIEKLEERGLPPDGFSELNTYWGPVRLSGKTVEARSLDSNDTSLTLAAAAVYLGASRNLESGASPPDVAFSTIKELEEMGIAHGSKPERMREYLTDILSYARGGLETDEKSYLEPIERILRDGGVNRSDEILSYAQEQNMLSAPHTIDPRAVPDLRLEIAERFTRDLYGR